MKPTLAFFAGFAALAAVAYAGCHDSPVGGSPAQEAGGPEGMEGELDSSRADGASLDASSTFRDWDAWDAYSPRCGMRVPSNSAQLPTQFKWETCDEHPNLPGVACRRISFDWEPSARLGWLRDGTTAVTLDSGRVVLFGSKLHDAGAVTFAAEADGPFLSAIYAPYDPCVVLSRRGSATHYASLVYEFDGDRERDEHGIVGGEATASRPHVVARVSGSHGLTATADGVIRGEGPASAVVGYPWAGGGPKDYFSGHTIAAVGTWADIFFFGTDSSEHSLKVHSPSLGVVTFAGFPNDRTRGAGDLATDGKVWVWTEGAGRVNTGTPYAQVSLRTAPFVRDPKELSPRTVRSDLTGYGFSLSNMQVGCGRAAKYGVLALGDDRFSIGVQIVDLATGEGWFLPSDKQEASFVTPLALTCDEVFVRGQEVSKSLGRTQYNVYRLRLDSLAKLRWPNE